MTTPSVTRQFIDTDTGQLHLRVAGRMSSALPLICLHMMPKSGRGFAQLLPELAKDRLVIAPDYPGYGESDPYPDSVTPAISDYADSVSQLLDVFELERVCLLGNHTGSMIAVELAHRYPQRIAGVINISAPIFTQQEVQELQQYFAPVPLDTAGTRFQIMWERVLQYRGPGMTMEMAAVSMAENLRGGERYEDGHYAAFAYTETYVEKLRELEQPVLVINPGDDLFEQTRRVDRYLRHGRREDFPDWGHGFLELWPGAIAKIVLEFLDSDCAEKVDE